MPLSPAVVFFGETVAVKRELSGDNCPLSANWWWTLGVYEALKEST
jgi:hypothetical protein